MDISPKDLMLGLAVVISVFCLIAMVIQYIQNCDYKERVNQAFGGLRSRISEWEGSVQVNASAIAALRSQVDATEAKLTKVLNELIDQGIIIDWNRLTDEDAKKLAQPIQEPIGDLVGKCKAEMDPIHIQYSQATSSAEHLTEHRKKKAKEEGHNLAAKYPHYYVNVEGLDVIDFYRIAMLYNITDPCIQHALKKMLAIGNRGHKGRRHDIQDIIDTLTSRLRIMDEDGME